MILSHFITHGFAYDAVVSCFLLAVIAIGSHAVVSIQAESL